MMKLSLIPQLLLLCTSPILAAPPLATNLEMSGQVAAVSRRPIHVIFHPPTGLCVLRKTLNDPLKLGPCHLSDNWQYTPQRFLLVKGTYYYLQAVEPGKPARLSIICSESDSSWKISSSSTAKNHFSTELEGGQTLCLDVDSDNTLIANPCVCSSSEACQSESQWFEFTTKGKAVDAYNAADSP